jgi:hypothetical protein
MQPICCTQSLSSIIISCTTCKSNHHLTCLTNDWIIPPLLCDPLYSLSSCSTCIPNLPPNLFRLALSWSDVLHISLLNLQSQKEPRRRSAEGLAYYHVKLDLTPFIELNWNMFWSRYGCCLIVESNTRLGDLPWLRVFPRFINSYLGSRSVNRVFGRWRQARILSRV